MAMIITLHFLGHGRVLSQVELFSPMYYVVWAIDGFSFISVNCYVLISGYFLCEQPFRLKRIITTMGQVLFYSITIYVILVATHLIDFSLISAIKSFTPTLSKEYWFVTIYIGMILLSPFANCLIRTMNQFQHFLFIAILILLFSIIPTLTLLSEGLNFGGGTGIVWFMTLYFVAAYIKKYYTPTYRIKNYLIVYFVLTSLIPASRFLISLLSKTGLTRYIPSEIMLRGSALFYHYHSILCLGAAVACFMLFLNIKIQSQRFSKQVLFLSPLTFAIYLIHDNNNLRSVLWGAIQPGKYANEWWLSLMLLGTVVAVYAVGAAIELLRRKIFYKIEHNDKLEIWCNRIQVQTVQRLERICYWK